MIHVGLNHEEHRAFEAALATTHRMRAQVSLQTLDGHEVADLSPRLVDGQVNIDATAETTRQASLTLDDPNHSLHLDSGAPADGALYVDRMVAITYGVFVESLGKWIDVPVFVGPIVGMTRDGSSVSVECLGKEHLCKGNAWHTMTLHKGTNTVDAIKRVLRERGGERRFDVHVSSARIPRPGVTVGRMDQAWAVAQQLADSIDRQLYYDGSGLCRLRRRPRQPVFTFRSGDGGTVITQPQVAFDLSTISNAVLFKGGKPEGRKEPVKARAVARRTHPLSPWNLGRKVDGEVVPRYLVTQIENSKVRSIKDANKAARTALQNLLDEGVEVTFDALPVPHLDALDTVRVTTGELTLTFVLKKASLPLVHSGLMSVGANRRVTPDKRRIRSRS